MVTKGKDMNIHKLVPVEPTEKMGIAGCDAVSATRFALSEMVQWYENISLGNNPAFQYYGLAKKILLTAAPAVQGEPVAMSNDKMRSEFDSWIEQRGMSTMKDGETYYHRVTHVAWQAWKASRDTLHPVEQHPDDAAVDRFAAAMKAKLNEKRREGRRGGWQSMTAEQLSALLHEHVRKGDPVDVANLAMMLHQNGQRIEQKPQPDVSGLVEALEQCITSMLDSGYRTNAVVIRAARAALAAYRKQGGK